MLPIPQIERNKKLPGDTYDKVKGMNTKHENKKNVYIYISLSLSIFTYIYCIYIYKHNA